MAKVLVVDDERPILNIIKSGLEKDHHCVSVFDSSLEVLKEDLSKYDLMILDIMMPELDGFELCRKIRSKVNCPILFLTAKDLEEDILFGLGLGADDYLTKPFRISELRARVNAHLRRQSRNPVSSLHLGDISLDLSGKSLSVNGEIVVLTKGEYAICEYLATHRGQVFSKEQIYVAVFGYDAEGNDSTIAVHIKNIRTKLSSMGQSPIETVWGIGYKWS